MNIEEFIAQSTKIHNDAYDYSTVAFINKNTKVDIRCKIHGIYSQLPKSHLNGMGCRKCSAIKRNMPNRKSYDDIISEFKDAHGSTYDYSKISYINTHTKICIICPEHGEFYQTPAHHKSGQGCPKCAKIKNLNLLNSRKISFNSFTTRSSKIHKNKYEYVKATYTELGHETVIICPIHGEFLQMARDHITGRGCKLCGYDKVKVLKSLTRDEFIEQAKKVHGNIYDYSTIIYNGGKFKIGINCPIHGIFHQRPNNHLQGQACPKCASHISNGERALKTYIKGLNLLIEDNSRTIIPPQELDIYIPSIKLAIEFNGLYWHGETKGKNRKYHLNKTLECNKLGIKLLHITDDEWINKKSIVKSRLKNILGLTSYKLYGRKCVIKEIDIKTKTKFLNKYHIQGADKSSVKLGAFYKNRLVAVMTFGKNRYGKDKKGFELIRYATISSFSCIGVAGKLLKYFERHYNPENIKTYADLRWSDGGLYKALGFQHLHNSTPNYSYFKGGEIVGSRIQFQKHKLKDKLQTFNRNISEWENMKANGYDRIWDCGNMVFEKIY